MPLHVALLVAVMNEQPQLFTSGNLVFISGKYVIENLEQYITISYVTITNNKNPNYEFDISNNSVCVLHCMISVTVNHKPKEIEDHIHFRVESIEYNCITGSSAVKMQMTALYSSQATRFQKYLDTLGSNIKLENRQDAFKSTETLVDASVKIGSSCIKLHDQPDYIELDNQDDKQDETDFEDEDGLDDDAQIKDEEHEEDLQPKK
ncbi:46270_t:CDS:2 [Gigaspora margarita]|uniref:46270_t:CDS:1 n=1 Tax=Gigaspora margarita TaxID=4874 RepID=A0ABN7W3Q1_GIGMA|nr:46270_t:CDS:2 [Gigaspora margarita]